MKLRPYNWNVFYNYHILNPYTKCSIGTSQGLMQIEAETESEAVKIAKPMINRLGGKIYKTVKHGVYD